MPVASRPVRTRRPAGRREIVPDLASLSRTELRLGRADGSWFRSLTLEDVALLRPGGDTAVAVRRLHLRYRLWPLVHHTFALDSVRIEAPDIRIRPGPDSTWTLLTDERTVAAPAGGGTAWTARIGVLRVDDARFDAAVTADSV